LENIPANLAVLGIFGERVFDDDEVWVMKSVLCAALGFSSLLLVSVPAEASSKRVKVLETRNSPGMAWTCKTNLSGGRVTTLKGRFTESRTNPKVEKGSPESTRIAAIEAQTDDFDLLTGSGLLAINNGVSFEEKEFHYLVSSKTKDDEGVLTLNFEFLLATNSGSVVILRWNNSGHSVEGAGLCTVQLDSGAPR
jgi:hypothetical protein